MCTFRLKRAARLCTRLAASHAQLPPQADIHLTVRLSLRSAAIACIYVCWHACKSVGSGVFPEPCMFLTGLGARLVKRSRHELVVHLRRVFVPFMPLQHAVGCRIPGAIWRQSMQYPAIHCHHQLLALHQGMSESSALVHEVHVCTRQENMLGRARKAGCTGLTAWQLVSRFTPSSIPSGTRRAPANRMPRSMMRDSQVVASRFSSIAPTTNGR